MSALSIAKWPARFSHANCEKLKKIANQAIKGMAVSVSLATDKCTTCSECKISTSDISKNPQVMAKRKFELVNSDICGPLPESLHGNKYAICFIDDFSRYATGYFRASKGNLLAKLQIFPNTLVQPCNVTIFTLKSDNGENIFHANFKIFAQLVALYSDLLVPFLLI